MNPIFPAWYLTATGCIQIVSVLVVLWCIRKWRRLIRDLIYARDSAENNMNEAMAGEAKALNRVAFLERRLHLIASTAGLADPVEACRLCIHLAKTGLEEKA